MEQEQIPTDTLPITEEEEAKEPEVRPTKTVKNFWERLDEVFALNVESARMREQFEDIIGQFSDHLKINNEMKSYIFQPDRLSLNSSDALGRETLGSARTLLTRSYSSFKIRLEKPCLGVKSIEMLRASIPTPVTNIPDSQTMFFYYIVPNVGAPSYAPDYTQLTVANMRMIRLLPTSIFSPNSAIYNPQQYGWNRTFTDYQDLVGELNRACADDPSVGRPGFNQFYAQNEIQFIYDQTFNKIKMVGTYYANGAPALPNNYYVIAGYDDPNVATFINNFRAWLSGINDPSITLYPVYPYTYNLNTRLGYTWNGLLPNPNDITYETAVASQMNPLPEFNGVPPGGWVPFMPYRYADTYADLVYTGCVYLFLDFVGGSSEASSGQGGLLSCVPVSTGNNSITFYNNVIRTPLTKIPFTLTEFEIRMQDDSGQPFYLPNSAIVNVEIGLHYN